MKILVQRVSRATVSVDGSLIAGIGGGLLLFVGVETGDEAAQATAAASKIAGLRIFADDAGRMNRDILESGGSALIVSQFTLAGSVGRGRRPSFDGAAEPGIARALVDRLAADLATHGVPVQQGMFGAHMAVELVNDGPVTFLVAIPPA